MNSENPELLPRWGSRVATTSKPGRGLLDELLEDGSLIKDLVLPGQIYRVTTRLQADSKAWVFRNAVSCDGEEVTDPAWAPMFHDLAAEVADGERDLAARKELARRALEAHLALCTRVEQALEQWGGLFPPSRRGSFRGWLGLGIGLLVVSAVGVGLWKFQPWSLLDSAAGDTDQVEALQAAISEEGAHSEEASAESPKPSEQEAAAGDSQAEPTAEGDKPVEVVGLSQGPFRPSPPRAAPARQKMVAPVPAPAPPQQVDSKPESGSAIPDETSADAKASASGVRSWPVSEITPSDHSRVRLEAGNQLYYGDDVRLTEVPPDLQGLTCITARSARGESEQGIYFQLATSARVLIAFDSEVKNRPAWLDSFRQTGATLKVVDMDRARAPRTLLIFEKTWSKGAVALGANTDATRLGRLARNASRRNTLMYLVCVDSPIPQREKNP